MSHSTLMDAAFGFKEKEHPDFPLMYQGMSNQFFGPTEDQPMTSEEDGIDFEAEFGILTSEVPFGAPPEVCAKSIRLVCGNSLPIRGTVFSEGPAGKVSAGMTLSKCLENWT